jgi:PAS domain S-box-containing protein
MDGQLEHSAEEIKRLRRCINDLVSVLAIPATWIGGEPSQIVRSLLEVLPDMLRLDLVYVRLEDPAGGVPMEMARIAQPRSSTIGPQEIGKLLIHYLGDDPQKWPPSSRNRMGDEDISIVPLRLGLQGDIGMIVAGSRRLDFPGQTERLLLSVAVNQAAIGLQEAWLLSEQRLITGELDQRVAQRTSELAAANEELKKEIAERRLAEERLRQEEADLRRSEAYLAEAQQLSHTGSFGWKISSGELTWSDETFRIFEVEPTTKPTLELVRKRVHPEDARVVNQVIGRASQDGRDFDHEHRLLMPDGSVKHVRVVAHAERAGSGELQFVGAVMDVTVAKETEAYLRTSAKIAQSLVAVRAEVGAALSKPIQAREMLQECAQAMVRHLEAAFARIWILNHEEDMLELQASAGAYTRLDGTHSRIKVGSLKVGLIAQEQKAYLTNDILNDPKIGDKEWARSCGFVSFAGHPLVVDGRTVGVIGMFARHPLSDAVIEALASVADTIAQGFQRKRNEDELRRTEAYLSEGQRLSHTGSWAWNVKTREYLFWSREHYCIYGFDPEADTGRYAAARERVHPDDAPALEETLNRAIQARSDFETNHRIILPGGAIKHLHVLGHPGFNDSGDVVEYIGTVMDVTERQRSEEALRKAQADLTHVSRITTLGELTASIAHEVNQPLGSVINNANACLGLLPGDAPQVNEVREALVEIIQGADQASAVITRVRQLVRKAPSERTVLNLRDVVADVLALARYDTTARRVAIRTEFTDDMPSVKGDRVQLQQVLLNLVVNGMDAMNATEESKRVLTIWGRHDTRGGESGCLLGVQDAGSGLKPDEMDQLFEAFYTTKPQGMGMGLAISRSIIEAHGGRLWAEANQGSGATFLFSLPEMLSAKP